MEIYFNKSVEDISIKNPVITIGTFDGIHLGHQKIFSQLKQKAQDLQGSATMITFSPHPRFVLYNNLVTSNFLIYTLDEKVGILEDCGVEHCIVLNFTTAFSTLSADDFARIYLFPLRPHHILLGHDLHFGKDRKEAYAYLSENKREHKFTLEKVSPQKLDGEIISSTKVRTLIKEGKVKEAKRYLERNYSFSGIVVQGSKRGRIMGFPTANINIDDRKVIPGDGVYAVHAIYDQETYQGMMHIGTRPTFIVDELITIEVHIFDFDKEIYGEKLTIICLEKIRDIIKFPDKESLLEQMKKDKKQALDLMKSVE